MPVRWAKNWPLSNGIVAPCESSFDLAARDLPDKTKALMDARQRTVDTLGNLSLLTEALNRVSLRPLGRSSVSDVSRFYTPKITSGHMKVGPHRIFEPAWPIH